MTARKKKTAPSVRLGLPSDYAEFLKSLKARVRQAQTKAMLSVNRELIRLYWDIGRRIVERQEREGWGRAVVERLADDMQAAFVGWAGSLGPTCFECERFFWPTARLPKLSHSLWDNSPANQKSHKLCEKSPNQFRHSLRRNQSAELSRKLLKKGPGQFRHKL